MADYGVRYRLDFCDVLGVKKRIDICKRDYNGDINPMSQFTGAGNPISITWKNEEDNKFNQITGSEAVIRIISNPVIDLNTFYSEDERMWKINFYSGNFTPNTWDDTRIWNDILSWTEYLTTGADLAWTGYLMPDSSSEPFRHIYEFEIKAKDVLGTLKTVPYAYDTVLVKKVDSLKNILIECLNKTDLRLNTIISTDTFESSMAGFIDTDCPLEQTYVDTNRFIDTNNKPYSCYDVIKHICNQFSANIRQVNGKWHFIDVTQYMKPTFLAREYNDIGAKIGVVNINANKPVLPDQLVHSNHSITMEPGYKTVTSYYQYGYLSNKLVNGDFNIINPGPVIDKFFGWTLFGGLTVGVGRKNVTTPAGQTPIDDYYVIIENKGFSKGLRSTPVSVVTTNTIGISAYVKSITAIGTETGARRVNFGVRLSAPGKSDLYWQANEGVWKAGSPEVGQNIQVRPKASAIMDGTTVEFSVGYPPHDGSLTLFIYGVEDPDGDAVSAIVDDAKINIDESEYYKSAIGYVYQYTNVGQYSKNPEPVVLQFGDDSYANRTSWMRLSNGNPTVTWFKKGKVGFTPTKLQGIVAQNILIQHQKPSRRFEGSLMGDFTPLDAFTIPMIDAKFMFMSGTFDVKSATCDVVLAEIFTNESVSINVSDFEDKGDFKDKDGNAIGSSSGININPVVTSGVDSNRFIQNGTEYQAGFQFNVAKGTFQEELRIPKAGGGTRKIYIA